jgi:multidrug resistance efflux pump
MTSNDACSDVASIAAPQIPVPRLLFLSALALAAGIGLSVWLEIRGSTSYGGSLGSHSTSITAPRGARIQQILISPGQRVAPGDKLLQLSDDHLLTQISAKQRELVELEADLKRVKAQADVELELRRRELNGEIFQTRLKVASLNQEKIAKQVEQLAWQDHLKSIEPDSAPAELVAAVLPVRSTITDSPFPDQRRLLAMVREDAAAGAIEALGTQLELCEHRLQGLQKIEGQLQEKVRISVGVDLVEARISTGREQLAGLEKQREALTVVSGAHGIVGAIHHQPGDLLKAGDPVIELLDDDRLHLIACIPSSAATRLHEGTQVKLVFPGKQSRIGLVAAIPPHTIPADPTRPQDDSHVEVKVEPAGKLWPKLPVGSRVQVQVLQ